MKFVQIIAGCDMTHAMTGEAVPAQETLYLAFGADPSKMEIRELDLAKNWADQLREFVTPYMNASHEPGEIEAPGGQGGAGTTGSARRVGTEGGVSTIVYNRQMRKWADDTGYACPDGTPGYHRLDGGGYRHSRFLIRAYADYLVSVATDTAA